MLNAGIPEIWDNKNAIWEQDVFRYKIKWTRVLEALCFWNRFIEVMKNKKWDEF